MKKISTKILILLLVSFCPVTIAQDEAQTVNPEISMPLPDFENLRFPSSTHHVQNRYANETLTPMLVSQSNFLSSTITEERSITAQEEEVNTGQDFTKPLTRFDIRYKYQNTTGDTETSLWTFRVDKPFVLNDGWKLSTRFDLPLIYSDVASLDNPRGDYEFGFSDTLTQALFISPQHGHFAYGFGAQMIWPTASQDQMGTGKYQLAPTIGAIYYPEDLPKGSFYAIVLRDFFDIGGDDDRADIHQFSIQPMFNYSLPDSAFVTFGPDMRINWEQDDDLFVPFNITLGKMINRSTVASVELNMPIVNEYDRYDCEIEFRIGFFF
jgi:hypothetical protein